MILDSPPVLPVADTRILAQITDGTLLVIREGHCHREDITETMRYLDICGAKFLGMVYIGSKKSSGKSPYYRYEYA